MLPFQHIVVDLHAFIFQVGFDSVHFWRIDYQDKEKREVDKSLEVVWHGSKTFGSSSQVYRKTSDLLFFFLQCPFFLVIFNLILRLYTYFCTYCVRLQIFVNTFPDSYDAPSGFHFEVTDDFFPIQV